MTMLYAQLSLGHEAAMPSLPDLDAACIWPQMDSGQSAGFTFKKQCSHGQQAAAAEPKTKREGKRQREAGDLKAHLANALANVWAMVILPPAAVVTLLAVRHPRWPHQAADGAVLSVHSLPVHLILHLGRLHPALDRPM